jgi:hypothetical protein
MFHLVHKKDFAEAMLPGYRIDLLLLKNVTPKQAALTMAVAR